MSELITHQQCAKFFLDLRRGNTPEVALEQVQAKIAAGLNAGDLHAYLLKQAEGNQVKIQKADDLVMDLAKKGAFSIEYNPAVNYVRDPDTTPSSATGRYGAGFREAIMLNSNGVLSSVRLDNKYFPKDDYLSKFSAPSDFTMKAGEVPLRGFEKLGLEQDQVLALRSRFWGQEKGLEMIAYNERIKPISLPDYLTRTPMENVYERLGGLGLASNEQKSLRIENVKHHNAGDRMGFPSTGKSGVVPAETTRIYGDDIRISHIETGLGRAGLSPKRADYSVGGDSYVEYKASKETVYAAANEFLGEINNNAPYVAHLKNAVTDAQRLGMKTLYVDYIGGRAQFLTQNGMHISLNSRDEIRTIQSEWNNRATSNKWPSNADVEALKQPNAAREYTAISLKEGSPVPARPDPGMFPKPVRNFPALPDAAPAEANADSRSSLPALSDSAQQSRVAASAQSAEVTGRATRGVAGAGGTGAAAYGVYNQLTGQDRANDMLAGGSREALANTSLAANATALGLGAGQAAVKSASVASNLGRGCMALAAVGATAESMAAHEAADGFRLSRTIGGFTGAMTGGVVAGKVAGALPIPHPIAKGVVAGAAAVGGGIIGGMMGAKASEEQWGSHLQSIYDKETKGEIEQLGKQVADNKSSFENLKQERAVADQYGSDQHNFQKAYEKAQNVPDKDRGEALGALQGLSEKLSASAAATSKLQGLSTEKHMDVFNAREKSVELMAQEHLRTVPKDDPNFSKHETARLDNIKNLETQNQDLADAVKNSNTISHASARAGVYAEYAKEAVNGYGLESAKRTIEGAGGKLSPDDGWTQSIKAHENRLSKIEGRIHELDGKPAEPGKSAADQFAKQPQGQSVAPNAVEKASQLPWEKYEQNGQTKSLPNPVAPNAVEKPARTEGAQQPDKPEAPQIPDSAKQAALEHAEKIKQKDVALADNGKTTPDQPQVQQNQENKQEKNTAQRTT